jgi:hypothetical protein
MLKKPGVMHILVDLVPEKPTATFLVTAQDKERNRAAFLKMYLNDTGLLILLVSLAGAPVFTAEPAGDPWPSLMINLRISSKRKIITLINPAVKRLLISGYPAGYLMGDCPGWQRMGGMI